MSDRLIVLVIVLVVSAVLGTLLYRAQLSGGEDQTSTPAVLVPKQLAKYTIVNARTTECYRVGNRAQVRGIVENGGTDALISISLQVLWKDESRNIIDTSITSVRNEEDPLAPGESRVFEYARTLSNVAKCNVRVLDWWVLNQASDPSE